MVAGPAIEIDLGIGPIRIRQRRPDVTSALRGRRVSEALELLPRLLPVCGAAQTIAAERALEAARGEAEDDATRADRTARLLREQAVAFAWRGAVDVPRLLGDAPRPERVLGMRDAPDAGACARALEPLAAGAEALGSDGTTRRADASRLWARWLARLDPHAVAPSIEALRGARLAARARSLLAAETFAPSAPGLAGPAEVGPLVWLGDAVRDRFPRAGPLRQRVLALLLDGERIGRELLAAARSDAVDAGRSAWPEAAGVGVGCARTARGAVFHRVRIDAEGDRIVDWRALAPTDWHFAPGGAVAATCAALDGDQGAVPFAVAGFDACAPVRVAVSGTAPAP